jgi:hypothetical protein
MPKPVTVTIPHELGKAEAKRRLAESFGSIRQQLAGGSIALAKVDETWEGDRMRFEATALGQHIRGHLDVGDTAVVVQIMLPRILGALAKLITRRVSDEGRQLLLK